MRLNEETVIIGQQVLLAPYRHEHVERYHQWMKDPALLEATASEPLTLEEEYAMQQKWHLDEDKLTFIILALTPSLLALKQSQTTITSAELEECQMIGDVNFFLPDGPKGEDVECEIMIAETSYRKKGVAQEALSLLFNYSTSPPLSVPPLSLIARIGTTNEASIRLFRKLGFGMVKVVEVFQEAEMRFGWNEDAKAMREPGGEGWGTFEARRYTWKMT